MRLHAVLPRACRAASSLALLCPDPPESCSVKEMPPSSGEEEFVAYDDVVYKLASERTPQVRTAQIPGFTGTTFSWAPALPGGATLGDGGRSDAGFLVYNVANSLHFTDQRAASGEPPDMLEMRARPTCHDLHWCERAAGGGTGSPELELLVGFLTGEVLLWRPLQRKTSSSRGVAVPCCKEGGADGAGVSVLKWMPHSDACFVTAHVNGRLLFYDRRKAEEGGSPPLRGEGGGGSGRRGVRHSISIRRDTNGPLTRHSPCASWNVSDAAINALAFTADGQRLALATGDGVLAVYDLGALRSTLPLRSACPRDRHRRLADRHAAHTDGDAADASRLVLWRPALLLLVARRPLPHQRRRGRYGAETPVQNPRAGHACLRDTARPTSPRGTQLPAGPMFTPRSAIAPRHSLTLCTYTSPPFTTCPPSRLILPSLPSMGGCGGGGRCVFGRSSSVRWWRAARATTRGSTRLRSTPSRRLRPPRRARSPKADLTRATRRRRRLTASPRPAPTRGCCSGSSTRWMRRSRQRVATA